mmetsp:Transcript_128719/g.222383  ORF Transcript_128719/g.222383 Transcript_128719/m.222383 type:complete len:1619 (-) Transcript_128719:314-5170(-)
MTSLSDLYLFFCKRSCCRANTLFVEQLKIDEKQTRVFDFSQNFVGEKGIDPVLETARNNMNLERLDVSNNYLNKESVEKIVKVAVRHPTLTSIDLSHNPIHLSSCKPLLFLLAKNPNIQDIGLEGTDVVPAMRERIKRELESNRAKTDQERQQVIRHEADLRALKAERALLLPGNVAVGQWKGESAGGCLTYTTWRENPQFLLYPTEDGMCTIEMRQRDSTDFTDKIQQQLLMGLMVVEGSGVQQVLAVRKGMTVGESEYTDEERVRLSVRLQRRVKGQDHPYVVIATTVAPGKEGRFTLTCLSGIDDNNDDVRYQIDAVDDSYDWFRTPRIASAWTAQTAGGCRKHTTWRHNEQYRLSFPERARRVVKVVILLAKALDEEDNDKRHIGFCVVAGLPEGRRRIMIDPSDVVGESKVVRKASVSLELDLDPRAEGYYIIPFTKEPGQEGPFTLKVYASSEVQCSLLDTAQDWPEYPVRGCWDQDCNGGYRGRNPSSWMHNPSFAWNVDGPTDVLFCLERVGEGRSVQLATGLFKGGQGAGRMAVGLLITANDDEFSPVQETAFGHDAEVTLLMEGVRPKKGGFLAIPCTFDAGDHSEWVLRVFASAPLRAGSLAPMVPVTDRYREKEIVIHDRLNQTKRAEPTLPKALKGVRQDPEPASPSSRSPRSGTCKAAPSPTAGSSPEERETLRAAAAERDRIIAECERYGRRHIDRGFPAGPTSLYYDQEVPPQPIPLVETWQRPTEVISMESPQLFVTDGQPSRMQVGHWDTTWLLGAFGLLASRPEMLERLFVAAYPEYGFYQVRFFRFGKWQVVTVDDYLPVDNRNGLIFARSSKPDELWVSILEKAYAKVQGNYEALRHGSEAQAMMDFTGGPVDPLCITEPGEAPVPGPKREAACAHIWDTILEYDRQKWILGCGVYDKVKTVDGDFGAGILYNKMYAVVDCRLVQGHKLLRLRNPWGHMEWRGKWSDTSDWWTDEMLTILDYTPADDGTFWMSFADFCYFFNRMFLCRLPANTPGQVVRWYGAWDGYAGGTEHHKTFISNEQYGIDLEDQGDETVPMYIVLSQPDALGQTAVYESIGFYVIEADDNTQRLKAITAKEVVYPSGFVRGREVAATVALRPDRRYVIVPTTEEPRKHSQYMVMMSCRKRVTCALIAEDQDTAVQGKWRHLTAGGAPGVYGTWRLNTQWLLYPTEACRVTLRVEQRPLQNKSPDPLPLGLTVLDGRQIKRTLEFDPKDVVASAGQDRVWELSIRVPVQSMRSRGGRPYVVIPHLLCPGQEAAYTLTARCNKKLQLKQVDPDFDWHHTQVKGGWHEEARTAGGCFDYSSWRENLQYRLQFLDEHCDAFIMLSKVNPPGSPPDHNTDDFGFVVAKGSSFEAGRRQKLTIAKEDVVIDAMGSADHVIGKGALWHNGAAGYYVIPYTRLPDVNGAFVMDIYTSGEATCVPVKASENWRTAAVVGEWIPGENAGGSRATFSTWYNNPFYTMRMQYPTTCLFVITQLPRAIGPDAFTAPSTTKAGMMIEQKKQKRLRQMPQTERVGNVPIGIDLCMDDEDCTILASAEYSPATEVVLTVPALQVASKPYFVVPHSQAAQHDGKYQLTVYSDLPVELAPVIKGRVSKE